jgi:hypothetical protein
MGSRIRSQVLTSEDEVTCLCWRRYKSQREETQFDRGGAHVYPRVNYQYQAAAHQEPFLWQVCEFINGFLRFVLQLLIGVFERLCVCGTVVYALHLLAAVWLQENFAEAFSKFTVELPTEGGDVPLLTWAGDNEVWTPSDTHISSWLVSLSPDVIFVDAQGAGHWF